MRRRLAYAAFVAVLAGANLLAFRNNVTADLTPDRRFTLQSESVEVARRLPRATTATVYLPASSRLGREAKLLLERYEAASGALRYSFVDPTSRPGALLEQGVTPGQAVLQAGDRRVVVEAVTEQDVTSGMLRLIRERERIVCFSTGHGERTLDDPGPGGLTGIAAALRAAGYAAVALPAGSLASGRPPDCDVLVAAGATTPFTEQEAAVVRDLLSAEGKVFVLVDGAATGPSDALTSPWGVRVPQGLVIDPVQSLQRDALSPVVDRYPSFNPVVASLRAATVWPQTAGLDPGGPDEYGGGLVPDRGGLYVSPLAVSSPSSWLESGGGAGFQEGADRRGPVLVAAAVDASEVGDRERRVPSERPRVIRERLLVFGTVNLAANAFVDLLGNARLVLDGFAWLAQDEDLIGLVAKPVSPSAIALTAARRRSIVWWTVFLPASLALGAAGFAWALRRR